MRSMNRSILMVAALSLPLVVSTTAFADTCGVAGNLITNCGFESNGAISSSTLANDLNVLVTNPIVQPITGWTSSENPDFTGVTSATGTGNPADPNFASHGGSFSAFLGADTAVGPGTLSQTFSDTAGATETLTFWLNSQKFDGADNSFSYSIDGNTCTLCSFTNIAELGSYVEYSEVFTGTGSDTLKFTFTNDDDYFSLDDVAVAQSATVGATPEPSSLMLLGTGVLGLAGVARRKFLNA
jgi:hypothetical protein